MHVRRLSIALTLALAALAPAAALGAPPAQGSGRNRAAVLVGVEDGDGDAGLQLRGDVELPSRPLSPVVGLSFVGSLGFSRFHDEYTNFFTGERVSSSLNLFRLGPAARFSFAVHPSFRPYLDAGAGLYYAGWSFEYRDLATGARFSGDDSEVGLFLRFAAGATLALGDGFWLGAEIGFTPYLGDVANDTMTSALLSATFRL